MLYVLARTHPMSLEGAKLRATINESLGLFVDANFAWQYTAEDSQFYLDLALSQIGVLKDKAPHQFEQSGYMWSVDRDSYNSGYEALLQFRLLSVLSQRRSASSFLSSFSNIGKDPTGQQLVNALLNGLQNPSQAYEYCKNIVVRLLPSSCARPQLRQVNEYHVLVLTTGYLLALRAFIRLWLEGCALGGCTLSSLKSSKEMKSSFLSAIRQQESEMERCATNCLMTFMDLDRNQKPFERSIFDDIVRQEDWSQYFCFVCDAVDGFVLFHEASHILAGHTQEIERSVDSEVVADFGALRFGAIEKRGGYGKSGMIVGAAIFYGVEKLSLFCHLIAHCNDRGFDLDNGLEGAIEELRLRGGHFGESVEVYLGAAYSKSYDEWDENMSLVSDAVRWVVLTKWIDREERVSLAEHFRSLDLL